MSAEAMSGSDGTPAQPAAGEQTETSREKEVKRIRNLLGAVGADDFLVEDTGVPVYSGQASIGNRSTGPFHPEFRTDRLIPVRPQLRLDRNGTRRLQVPRYLGNVIGTELVVSKPSGP